MSELIDDDTPLYSVTQVAIRLSVHPQTLRTYDRKGIVSPKRTGRTKRLYTNNHIRRLERLLELTGEGVNLPGAMRIMQLEVELVQVRELLGELEQGGE